MQASGLRGGKTRGVGKVFCQGACQQRARAWKGGEPHTSYTRAQTTPLGVGRRAGSGGGRGRAAVLSAQSGPARRQNQQFLGRACTRRLAELSSPPRGRDSARNAVMRQRLPQNKPPCRSPRAKSARRQPRCRIAHTKQACAQRWQRSRDGNGEFQTRRARAVWEGAHPGRRNQNERLHARPPPRTNGVVEGAAKSSLRPRPAGRRHDSSRAPNSLRGAARGGGVGAPSTSPRPRWRGGVPVGMMSGRLGGAKTNQHRSRAFWGRACFGAPLLRAATVGGGGGAATPMQPQLPHEC
jgi:hypothetical protein